MNQLGVSCRERNPTLPHFVEADMPEYDCELHARCGFKDVTLRQFRHILSYGAQRLVKGPALAGPE